MTLSRILLFAFAILVSVSSVAQTWTSGNNNLYGGAINDVIQAGQNLLVSTDGAGVFRSSDNGHTWQPSNAGLGTAQPVNFVIKGDTVFVGNWNGGVYYSLDNGENWQRTSDFFQQISNIKFIGNRLFIASVNGVFASEDRGQTFITKSGNLPLGDHGQRWTNFVSNAGTRLFAGMFYDGVWRSEDDGQTWTRVTDIPFDENDARCFLQKDGLIFIGTTLGLYASADNGISFIKVGDGITEPASCFSLAAKDGELYAATSEGLFVSTNNGSTFSLLTINHAGLGQMCEYVGSIGNELIANPRFQGIFRSADGITWTETNTGLNAVEGYKFHVKGNRIYAMTSRGTYQSTNGGASWDLMRINNGYSFFYASTKGDSLLAQVLLGGIMFSTTDHGASWDYFSNAGSPGVINLLGSFVNSDGAEIAYGSSSDGLYEYHNADIGWVKILPTTNEWFSNVLVVGDSIVTSSANGKMYMSRNKGVSWEIKNNGLPSSFYSHTATYHKKKIYIMTNGEMWVTADFGVNWQKVQTPANTWSYSITSDDQRLYLGTGYGLYVSPDEGLSWTEYNDSNTTNLFLTSLARFENKIFATTPKGVWSTPLNLTPAITSFTPTSAGVGDHITLTGKFFSARPATNIVKVNGVLAEVIVASSTQMIISVPEGAATGPISITVGGETGVSEDDLCIRPAKPAITTEAGSSEFPTLISSSDIDNQWFKNGDIIPGATNSFYNATEAGSYTVMVVSGLCNSAMSEIVCLNPETPAITQENTAASFPTLVSSNSGGNQWLKDGVEIPGATQQNYVVTAAGVYAVRAVAGTCVSASSVEVCIPVKASITSTTNTQGFVLTSNSATGNQWYFNGSVIDGATGQSYTPGEAGVYSVNVSNGTCSSEASVEVLVTSTEVRFDKSFTIYPTSVSNQLTADLTSFDRQTVALNISDNLGRTHKIFVVQGGEQQVISVDDLPSGVYILRATQNQHSGIKRFVKNQ